VSPAERLAEAFAAHEREHHGVAEPEPVPDLCLADVAARYETARIVEGLHRVGGDEPHVHRFRCLDPEVRDPACDGASLIATIAMELSR